MMKKFLFAVSLLLALPFVDAASNAARADFNMVIVNRCHETMSLALRLRDNNNVWKTMGWVTVRPRSTRNFPLSTNNRIIYIYGKSRSYTWHGQGHSGAKVYWIVNNRFVHPQGSGRIRGQSPRRVWFKRVVIPAGSYDTTQTFRCSG